jgi:hypothetical protein
LGKQKICGSFLLSTTAEREIKLTSAAEEDLLFLLAKTLSRKEESKAVLCAFPALRDLFLFFIRRGERVFFISLAKEQRRKGESKAVLCVLAALRELIFFYNLINHWVKKE